MSLRAASGTCFGQEEEKQKQNGPSPHPGQLRSPEVPWLTMETRRDPLKGPLSCSPYIQEKPVLPAPKVHAGHGLGSRERTPPQPWFCPRLSRSFPDEQGSEARLADGGG